MPAIITLDNICVQFDKTSALHNLSVSVKQGESLGIIRESGSEKPTLLNALVRLGSILQGQHIVNVFTPVCFSKPI